MNKQKLRTVVSGNMESGIQIDWVTHTGQPVLSVNSADIKSNPAAMEYVFVYGLRKSVADGAAGSPNPGRAMAERWTAIKSAQVGRRGPAMPHADLYAAIVAAGNTKLGTPDGREMWRKLDAATFAKLYAQYGHLVKTESDASEQLAQFGIDIDEPETADVE